MSERNSKSRRAHSSHRRRRRSRGVPTALVVFLLILALGAGAFCGFSIARMKSSDREALAAANARINELENKLTMIGYVDDPEFIFNDQEPTNGLADLAGTLSSEDEGIWSEPNILSGLISEDATSVVVAEFDGGVLYSDEVIPEYNDQLAAKAFAGLSTSDTGDLLMDVLTYKVGEKIVATRASELGFNELSDEELAQVRSEAEQIYEDQIAYYSAFVAQQDMNDDEIRAAAIAYLDNEGVNLDSLIEDQKNTFWTQKFFDYTVKDVTVSEEEIQAHYDAVLSDQKETFDQYPEAYEYAQLSGEVLLYNLPGYRAVRDILLPLTEQDDILKVTELQAQLESMDPMTQAEQMMAIQSQLDEIFAPLEETAQDVLGQLENGAAFEDMMDQYGADELLTDEPLRTEGFFISNNSFLNAYSSEFIEGSMILEEPGQVSMPLRSPMGLHIVQYVRSVPEGEVPLADVYDSIRDEALSLKRASYYEEQLTTLLESAHVKFYPERLQ